MTTGNITFDRDAERNLAGITLVRPKHLLEVRGGLRNPTWATVRDIAEALGVTIADIATRAVELEH